MQAKQAIILSAVDIAERIDEGILCRQNKQ